MASSFSTCSFSGRVQAPWAHRQPENWRARRIFAAKCAQRGPPRRRSAQLAVRIEAI
jgi:hypothetical protein